jgi:hypothetical protein
MIETVLILPILLAILLMVIYFGRELVRLQRVQVMATYDAWRVADGGTGPWSHDGGDPNDGDENSRLLNQLFFGERALDENGQSAISIATPAPYPDGATGTLVSQAAYYSTQTMDLVDARVARAPDGIGRRFKVSWPVELAYFTRFNLPIIQGHTRVLDEWKHNDAGSSLLPAVSDVFMPTLDNPLASMPSGLAGALRSQYRSEPPYVGPYYGLGP